MAPAFNLYDTSMSIPSDQKKKMQSGLLTVISSLFCLYLINLSNMGKQFKVVLR